MNDECWEYLTCEQCNKELTQIELKMGMCDKCIELKKRVKQDLQKWTKQTKKTKNKKFKSQD